jgi:PPOX class probable F420-dependent enzyme
VTAAQDEKHIGKKSTGSSVGRDEDPTSPTERNRKLIPVTVQLSDNARALFAGKNLAWVTTLRPDGSPHNTVVWADVDGDDVVFNTAVGRVKDAHIKANPQVSVSVLDPENSQRFASVSGIAEMTTEGADELIDSLAHKYLGVDSYPYRNPAEQRISVRVKAERLVEQA